MVREERKLGYLVEFEYARDALYEIGQFRRKEACGVTAANHWEFFYQESIM